jgi:hypothetical protein
LFYIFSFIIDLTLKFASHNPAAGTGLASDFREFWSVSHLATDRNAASIYKPSWFSRWQTKHIGMNSLQEYLQYIYPPPNIIVTLFVYPFNFFEGFIIWTVSLTATGVFLLRKCRVPWIVIVCSSIGPAFMFDTIIGQIGFITGAIFISGILSIEKSPRTAGSLLGALIIKPQAGLLGPIALLARCRYNALAAGTIVVAGLSVIVTIICGWGIWHGYLQHGMATAHKMLVAPFPTIYEQKGASVFWMFRSFGASISLAGMAQAISAIGAIIWCWIAWRRQETNRVALTALTVTLTLLVTPYGLTADMCGFSIMVVWLAWKRKKLTVPDVLMWLWPGVCPIVSATLHVELTPFILLLGAIRAWQQLSKSDMLDIDYANRLQLRP